jgi:hypothetical protein
VLRRPLHTTLDLVRVEAALAIRHYQGVSTLAGLVDLLVLIKDSYALFDTSLLRDTPTCILMAFTTMVVFGTLQERCMDKAWIRSLEGKNNTTHPLT